MNDKLDDIVRAHRNDRHKPPAHLVEQWHAAIDEAAALERGRAEKPGKAWRPGLAFFGAAVTAALALGIGIGFLAGENGQDGQAIVAPAPFYSSAAFSRGLQHHLRDSRTRLVSLDQETDATLLVLDIIAQNRMYEAAAENNNAPRIARVLRAFEPILLRLAADDIAPEDAAALREQLRFELDVMLTKMARDASDQTHTT